MPQSMIQRMAKAKDAVQGRQEEGEGAAGGGRDQDHRGAGPAGAGDSRHQGCAHPVAIEWETAIEKIVKAAGLYPRPNIPEA
ncbi:MAG: hypothetical protein MZV70_35900 [Desulfobacterales bacterium]|nr:hypothetical protein [Desulfobacterales bacterium]